MNSRFRDLQYTRELHVPFTSLNSFVFRLNIKRIKCFPTRQWNNFHRIYCYYLLIHVICNQSFVILGQFARNAIRTFLELNYEIKWSVLWWGVAIHFSLHQNCRIMSLDIEYLFQESADARRETCCRFNTLFPRRKSEYSLKIHRTRRKSGCSFPVLSSLC